MTDLTNTYNIQANTPEFDGIRLRITDPDMMRGVKDALEIMREKAPQHYEFMKHYIKEINQAPVSGMHVESGVFDLGKAPAERPVWIASIIYHDSIHGYQYQSNQPYSGAEAEAFANQKQLEFLEQVRANPSYLDHMKRIIAEGDHSDLNKDGVYDMKDYNMRTW